MDNLKRAVIFMLLSTSAFAVMNALAKFLKEFSTFELVFFRSLGTLVITMTLLTVYKIPLLGNKKGLLIARGILGTLSLLLFFGSLKSLPVGTAVTLRYLSPVFAAIFALVFLKERIRPVQWLFFMISFVGVLVIKGFDEQVEFVGLVLVVLSAIVLGSVYVVISKIGKQDHPLVIVNYFMAIGVLVGGVLALSDWRNPVGMEWVILGSLGVVGFIGQYFMTKAFQIASTTQVAPLAYLEVIFTVLLGILWFSDSYTYLAIIGILLVLTGLLCNLYYKSRIVK
ncbi:MAG: DMT family transporter [Nonlabens sp.]|nr:DMT family transporter [Nonlabens sp.]MDP5100348.1 DMT family transporter [Nonlabens sp.]